MVLIPVYIFLDFLVTYSIVLLFTRTVRSPCVLFTDIVVMIFVHDCDFTVL